jgi:hypothetical protein
LTVPSTVTAFAPATSGPPDRPIVPDNVRGLRCTPKPSFWRKMPAPIGWLRPLTLPFRKSNWPSLIPKPAPTVYVLAKRSTSFALPDQVPPCFHLIATSFSSIPSALTFASFSSRPVKSAGLSLSTVKVVVVVIDPK